MLRPDYPISTDRLVLRPFTTADVADVWAYQRQPEVARYLRWDPRDLQQTQDAVEGMAAETELRAEGDCLSLAVVLPALGVIVGQVELVWLSEEHRQGEIGYIFNPDHQGKGLATEAARTVLRLGFEELDLHRIVGRCNALNTASAKLMERLGMRREAHFIQSSIIKGAWREEFVYAILRSEWRRQD
ncbi:GNAT family N-acetyltransferase [Saccharopolyspora pogona]|uniref:GNAT family N-acetyltransferase n=1 Tax=Saccharopolyspora pogona TaxID=333966 RepID=UPI001689EC32|nr:GNAT family protein [Saccharopolyspora pogona]